MEGEGQEGHVCHAVAVADVVFRKRPRWQRGWLIHANRRGRGVPQDITIARQIEAISRVQCIAPAIAVRRPACFVRTGGPYGRLRRQTKFNKI
jgi:hypothetical protein